MERFSGALQIFHGEVQVARTSVCRVGFGRRLRVFPILAKHRLKPMLQAEARATSRLVQRHPRPWTVERRGEALGQPERRLERAAAAIIGGPTERRNRLGNLV